MNLYHHGILSKSEEHGRPGRPECLPAGLPRHSNVVTPIWIGREHGVYCEPFTIPAVPQTFPEGAPSEHWNRRRRGRLEHAADGLLMGSLADRHLNEINLASRA